MTDKTKERRTPCPWCERKLTVRALQVWKHKHMDASLRIIATFQDGAVVEQVGREDRESRWSISYTALIEQYREAR